MYCTYCGVQNPDNANFCSNCGKETSFKPTEAVDEAQPKVNHPWMSAQSQPRATGSSATPSEQSRQQHAEVQAQPQQQDQGEVPNALKSILSRVQRWSAVKKTIWAVVLGFLFLVCVGVIVGEPVEETNPNGSPKPTSTPKVDEEPTMSAITEEVEPSSKYSDAFITAVETLNEASEKRGSLMHAVGITPTLDDYAAACQAYRTNPDLTDEAYNAVEAAAIDKDKIAKVVREDEEPAGVLAGISIAGLDYTIALKDESLKGKTIEMVCNNVYR